jgi:hypothetical protein
MSSLKTRYVIRRADGMFFHAPTDTDIREWRPEVESAFRWVDLDACRAAAYIWHHLKGEDVSIVCLTLSDKNNYLEYSV